MYVHLSHELARVRMERVPELGRPRSAHEIRMAVRRRRQR